MQLLRAIVPRGRGSELMKILKDNGADAISCFYGYGSNPAYLSNVLHIDKIKKEVVMAILDSQKSNQILNAMEEKIKAHDTAIAFTSPLGLEGVENMEYAALYVIVDRQLGHQAIQIAQENGARGATLIHGRGSAKEVKSILINMNIEPEKDIVIMLVKKELVDKISDAIYNQMTLRLW